VPWSPNFRLDVGIAAYSPVSQLTQIKKRIVQDAQGIELFYGESKAPEIVDEHIQLEEDLCRSVDEEIDHLSVTSGFPVDLPPRHAPSLSLPSESQRRQPRQLTEFEDLLLNANLTGKIALIHLMGQSQIFSLKVQRNAIDRETALITEELEGIETTLQQYREISAQIKQEMKLAFDTDRKAVKRREEIAKYENDKSIMRYIRDSKSRDR
jgi:hypothetical protein